MLNQESGPECLTENMASNAKPRELSLMPNWENGFERLMEKVIMED